MSLTTSEILAGQCAALHEMVSVALELLHDNLTTLERLRADNAALNNQLRACLGVADAEADDRSRAHSRDEALDL
jgi:hypothetical protein